MKNRKGKSVLIFLALFTVGISLFMILKSRYNVAPADFIQFAKEELKDSRYDELAWYFDTVTTRYKEFKFSPAGKNKRLSLQNTENYLPLDMGKEFLVPDEFTRFIYDKGIREFGKARAGYIYISFIDYDKITCKYYLIRHRKTIADDFFRSYKYEPILDNQEVPTNWYYIINDNWVILSRIPPPSHQNH